MPSPNQDPFDRVAEHVEDIPATLEDVRVYFDDVEILTTAYKRLEDNSDNHKAYLRAEIQEKASWLLQSCVQLKEQAQELHDVAAEWNAPKRLTDDELLERHFEEIGRELISHAGARMIASQFHGGQVSALYSFSSTGEVSPEVNSEIEREMELFAKDSKTNHVQLNQLWYLARYVRERLAGKVEPYDGEWSRFWLEQPGANA